MSAPPDLRALPSVDRLLATPEAKELLARVARPLVVETLRAVLDERRRTLRSGGDGAAPATVDAAALSTVDAAEVLRETGERLALLAHPPLTPVVNATGILLHTNLGRASLPEEVVESIVSAARGPVPLESALREGRRGDRDQPVAADLAALTGAPAATVVNNNAAAVLLALNTLADGREAIV